MNVIVYIELINGTGRCVHSAIARSRIKKGGRIEFTAADRKMAQLLKVYNFSLSNPGINLSKKRSSFIVLHVSQPECARCQKAGSLKSWQRDQLTIYL